MAQNAQKESSNDAQIIFSMDPVETVTSSINDPETSNNNSQKDSSPISAISLNNITSNLPATNKKNVKSTHSPKLNHSIVDSPAQYLAMRQSNFLSDQNEQGNKSSKSKANKKKVPSQQDQESELTDEDIEAAEAEELNVDLSTKPGEISIDNYDKENPITFTDSGTVQALTNLGISSSELFMPSQAEISKYDQDPDFRSVFISHHESRISRLVTLVQRERRHILVVAARKAKNEGSNLPPLAQNSNVKGAIELEQKQLDHLKQKQKREVEALIDSMLLMDKIQRDNQLKEQREKEKKENDDLLRKQKTKEAHEKHLEHLKDMEEREKKLKALEDAKRNEIFQREKRSLEKQAKQAEEKKQAAINAEKQRLERAEQNRKVLEKIEDERCNRIKEKEQMAQERESRRLKALEEEKD